MNDPRYEAIGTQGADRGTLEGFAKQLNVAHGADIDDISLAESIHTTIGGLKNDEWDLLTNELKKWDVAMTNAWKEQPEPAAPAKEKEAEPTPEEVLAACRTKKEIIAAAEKLGSTLKIVKTWKVDDMKANILAHLKEKAAPEEPAPSRVTAGADPSADQVRTAKAGAANKAAAARAASAPSPKVEGEPYRRKTTSWMIWNIIVKAKKPLSAKEIKERFLAEFNKQTEIKSTNPEGRVTSTISHLKRTNVIKAGATAGTYELV